MPQPPHFKISYGDIAYQLALVLAGPQLAPLNAIIHIREIVAEGLADTSILAELEMFGKQTRRNLVYIVCDHLETLMDSWASEERRENVLQFSIFT